MDRGKILKYLAANKSTFKEEFGVDSIGLFGSYARGKNTEESDLDVVVEMTNPDMLELVGLKQKIEKDLGMKVDVVRIRDRMNHRLKKRIERDAVYA